MKKLLATTLALLTFAGTDIAVADDKAVDEAFYTQLLSHPNAADLEQRSANVLVENWVSIPTPRASLLCSVRRGVQQ